MEVIYGLILYVSICCWLCWLLMRVITLSFWLYWLDIWWGRFIDWWRRLCYRLLRLSNLEILILLYKKIKLLTKYFMQDIQLLIIRVQYVCWNFRIIINVLLCQVVYIVFMWNVLLNGWIQDHRVRIVDIIYNWISNWRIIDFFIFTNLFYYK
jgi:hypothetical protein